MRSRRALPRNVAVARARARTAVALIAYEQRRTYLFIGWSEAGLTKCAWYLRARRRFWGAFRALREARGKLTLLA